MSYGSKLITGGTVLIGMSGSPFYGELSAGMWVNGPPVFSSNAGIRTACYLYSFFGLVPFVSFLFVAFSAALLW